MPLDIQTALAATQCAEVEDWSWQPRQRRQRLNKTCGLPQGQSEQVLDGQAKLDGGIGEMRAAPAFAAASGKPGHVLIQPDGR